MDKQQKNPKGDGNTSFEDVLEMVNFLRSREGCKWDRDQDEKSLRPFFLEECYELIDAIDSGSASRMREELGDILLHCAFQIMLGEERGDFTRGDVISSILEKMRRRHPHLFSEDSDTGCNSDWETIKKNERLEKGMVGILDGLPHSLPPLLRSYRLQERVSRLNFDWHEPSGAFDKVIEELDEVREKHLQNDRQGLEMEIGDLLFSVVNVSRLLGFHPDNSLRLAVNKFAGRFDALLRETKEKGMDIEQSTLSELDEIWDRIKEDEKKKRR